MGNLIDITGKQFGQLKVLRQDDDHRNCSKWVCQCACGSIIKARGNTLRTSTRSSCCSKGPCLIGKTFGALTVINHVGKNRGSSLCRCSCGSVVKFQNNEMTHGLRKSCASKRCTALIMPKPELNPNEFILDGEIIRIKLNGGKESIIDRDDYEKVKNIRWRINDQGYVKEARSYSARILARVVSGAPPGKVVDHINHDTLDNRKVNIRVCTQMQNTRNTQIASNNTTGYKGVSAIRSKSGLKYRAYITHDGYRREIGRYNDKVEAAKAYNIWAQKLFGEFAFINRIPGD